MSADTKVRVGRLLDSLAVSAFAALAAAHGFQVSVLNEVGGATP